MASIGTHSGAFQADEALGVYMLRQLPQYQQAALVRSRDPEVLKPLTIVIDVGGSYDHAQLRYDHHQRGFFETFDGENPASKDGGRPDVTGPATATGAFKTKLSASGLIYKHYGREIICALHPSLAGSPDALEWVYVKMYKEFMEAIDGNDNGIEIAAAVNYKDATSLPQRVHRLNSPWNGKAGGPSETERFEKASALCGAEFSEMLAFLVEVLSRLDPAPTHSPTPRPPPRPRPHPPPRHRLPPRLRRPRLLRPRHRLPRRHPRLLHQALHLHLPLLHRHRRRLLPPLRLRRRLPRPRLHHHPHRHRRPPHRHRHRHRHHRHPHRPRRRHHRRHRHRYALQVTRTLYSNPSSRLFVIDQLSRAALVHLPLLLHPVQNVYITDR